MSDPKRSKPRRMLAANAAAAFSYFLGTTSSNTQRQELNESSGPEGNVDLNNGGAATGGNALASGGDGSAAAPASNIGNKMHRSQQPVYFSGVSADDADPVFSYCLSTSHPDSVLRRNGIVRQEGVYKNHHVYFNAKSCLWRRVDNDEPMPQAMPYFVADRFDKGPSGVIQIYGTDGVLEHDDITQVLESLKASHGGGTGGAAGKVSTPVGANPFTTPPPAGNGGDGVFPTAATSGQQQQQQQSNAMIAQHRENLRLMERYHRTLVHSVGGEQQHHDSSAEGFGGGHQQVNKVHQKRYVQQYLSRAIPEAARSANAVIILTRGNSLVAEQVSNGIASLQRNTRVNIAASTNIVDALAVTPFRPEIDPLHRGLTHHVVLRRSTVSRLPPAPENLNNVPPCLGWVYFDTKAPKRHISSHHASPSPSTSRRKPKSSLRRVSLQRPGGMMIHEGDEAAPIGGLNLLNTNTHYISVNIGATRAESVIVGESFDAASTMQSTNQQLNAAARPLPPDAQNQSNSDNDELDTEDGGAYASHSSKTCVFCGELAEWHAPYPVLRAERESSQKRLNEFTSFIAAKFASQKMIRNYHERHDHQQHGSDREMEDIDRSRYHPAGHSEPPAFLRDRSPEHDPNHVESPEANKRTVRHTIDIPVGSGGEINRSETPTPSYQYSSTKQRDGAIGTPPPRNLTDVVHHSDRQQPSSSTPQSCSRGKEAHGSLISEEPDAFETDQYVGRLVDQLAVGCRQELLIPGRRSSKTKVSFADMFLFRRRNAPLAPDRNQIPVVVILIGGEPHAAKRYITQCIARRYTILIVEGSGGYADYLGQMKRRIEGAFPFEGRDGILRYSTALDPLTAEILSCFDLVKFIRPGSKNEELTREIDGALKGEGVLSGVWKLYARVQSNAKYQARLFALANIFQMLLSLFVTFLTALQTYLLLQMVRNGESVPATFPSPADHRGSWFLWKWTAMQWSIIIIPISIAALQAFSSKADYGAKWIALRTMSHRLLSEIYQYRTSSLLYHEGEIERHRHEGSSEVKEGGGGLGSNTTSGGEGAAGEGGQSGGGGGGKATGGSNRIATTALTYKSRDDLLQLRAAELDRQTQEGACKQLNLFDDVKAVPPKNILEVDDGFSALTPDQYVRVRLRRMADVYERDALFFTQLLQWCQNGITLANGFGTGLAAIAAFTDGTIQAWLAFTTAFVATLLRVLEGFRLEFQMRKKVQTSRTLLGINAWWGSLRERADNRQNRNWLVEQVETAILDEVDAWAQQFGQALEMMKKGGGTGGGGDDDEGGEGGDKPGGGGKDDGDGEDRSDAPATLKGLELSELSVASLRRVLTDPTAPPKLKEQTLLKLKNLRSKLVEGNGGAAMTSRARREEELRNLCAVAGQDESTMIEGRNQRGEAVSITSTLEFPSLEQSSILPDFIENVLRSRPLDFTQAMKEVIVLRRGTMTGTISAHDDEGEDSMAANRRGSVSRRRSSARSSSSNNGAADFSSAQDGIVAASQISYCDCMMALRTMEELAGAPEDMSHRHNLELCKRMVASQLIGGLTSAVDRFKLRELCADGTTVDDLVAQFCSLALTPNVVKFSLSALLQLIRDPILRNNLAVLPDCESFFHRLVQGCLDTFSSNSFPFAVYQRLCEMIAEIDVDLIIMSDTSSGVALARSVETLFRYGIRPWVLQKADLVVAFPESMRSVIEQRSHYQLASYLDQALLSKPSLISVDHLINRFGSVVFPASFLQFLRSKREHQVIFASIVESLSQADILTKSMHHLIRLIDISFSTTTNAAASQQQQLAGGVNAAAVGGGGGVHHNNGTHNNNSNNGTGGGDSKLVHDMKERLEKLPLSSLRLAFSILQTIHSNTYGASIVDRTCDSIVDFSLREILNYENVVRLVMKLPELKAYNLHKCCHAKKAEILKIFGSKKLTEALDNLSDAQLRTIFYAFQFANPTDWTLDQVAGTLRAYLDEESEAAKKKFARISKNPRYQKDAPFLPGREEHLFIDDEHTTAEGEKRSNDSTALANFYNEEWVKDIMSWTGKTLLCLQWASAQTPTSKLEPDTPTSGPSSPGGFSVTSDASEASADFQPPATARTRHKSLEEMLEDAPDAMAKRALKSLDPKRAKEVLRLIQPSGIDGDVARVFGSVVAQGGYAEAHTNVLQTAFGRWQVRQASVLAISAMLLDTSNDLFAMDDNNLVDFFISKLVTVPRVEAIPDVERKVKRLASSIAHDLSEEETVKPWHPCIKSFGDSGTLETIVKDYCIVHLKAKDGPTIDVKGDFLSNLITELRLSAPLLVFYRLASLCTFLDIRELFDTVEQRTELVVLMTLVLLDDEDGTLFTERDATETRRSIAALREGPPGEEDDDDESGGFGAEESSASLTDSVSGGSRKQSSASSSFSMFEHQIFSDISSIDCTVMRLGDGRATNTLQKGYWRKRVLTAIHFAYEGNATTESLDATAAPPTSATGSMPRVQFLETTTSDDGNNKRSYGFERVASLLHNLSEPHLRFLFECHSKVLQSTVGNLLQTVVRYKRYNGRERTLFRIMSSLSVRDSFVFDIALSNLIRNIKIFPSEMSVSLDHLDPQKFASRSESERRTVLSMWMHAGSQGPLDVLLRASTVPSSLLSQSSLLDRPVQRHKRDPSLLVTGDDLLQVPSDDGLDRTTGSMTHHMGSIVFDSHTERAQMRQKNGRENLNFLKYVFKMIESAKPDNNKSSLLCMESKNESKLAAIMGRAQGWRVLVYVNRAANALKALAKKRELRNKTTALAVAAVKSKVVVAPSPVSRGGGAGLLDPSPLTRSVSSAEEWFEDSSNTEDAAEGEEGDHVFVTSSGASPATRVATDETFDDKAGRGGSAEQLHSGKSSQRVPRLDLQPPTPSHPPSTAASADEPAPSPRTSTPPTTTSAGAAPQREIHIVVPPTSTDDHAKPKGRWAKVTSDTTHSPLTQQTSPKRPQRSASAVRVVDPMASPSKQPVAAHSSSTSTTTTRAPPTAAATTVTTSVQAAENNVPDSTGPESHDMASPPSPPPRHKRPIPSIQRRTGPTRSSEVMEDTEQQRDSPIAPPALRSHNTDPMMATYSLSSLQQQGSSVAGGPAGSSLLAGELRRPLHRVNDDDSVQIAPHAEEEQDGDENIANEDATTASAAARETQ